MFALINVGGGISGDDCFKSTEFVTDLLTNDKLNYICCVHWKKQKRATIYLKYFTTDDEIDVYKKPGILKILKLAFLY